MKTMMIRKRNLMSNINVLLIWMNIPDSVDLYLIKNPTNDEIETLLKANGKFIGDELLSSKEQAPSKLIFNALYQESSRKQRWSGKWKNFKIKSSSFLRSDFMVIYTGVLL
jgi:hypothetical protein